MQLTLNKFIKRTVAGISALVLIAGTYTAVNANNTADAFKVNAADKVVHGDANCDGKIDVNDVEALAKYLKDSKKNPLTEQGLYNAAASYNSGASNTPNDDDLQAIIETLAGVNKLPNLSKKTPDIKRVYGDADCDGDVDFNDLDALNKYLNDAENYPLTEQGLYNAAASYNSGTSNTPNNDDLQAIIETLAGVNKLPNLSKKTADTKIVYGDADCDGDVDFNDVDALNKYLNDAENYPLTEQGLYNAAASYNSGTSNTPNDDDLQAIIETLSGVNKLPNLSKKTVDIKRVYGDADCDGDVDFNDVVALYKYLNDAEHYPLTEQGIYNAAASYNSGTSNTPNDDDLQAIIETLAGVNKLPNLSKKLKAENITYDFDGEVTYGDFNLDGKIDVEDAAGIQAFLSSNNNEKKISVKAIANGDVYDPGTGLNSDDIQAIQDRITGDTQLPVFSDDYLGNHYLKGDFNCDNIVNTKDVLMLNQHVLGKSNYKPSEQGLKNADVFKQDSGLTFDDVAAIAEFIAGTNSLPTKKIVNKVSHTLYGDFNCDNVVNTKDVLMLNEYINGKSNYQPSKQGLKNANVFKKDSSDLTADDVAAIDEFIAGTNKLPTDKIVNKVSNTLYGDFNCDNVFNVKDALMLQQFIEEKTDYIPSEQGKTNADIVDPGSGLNYKDLAHMLSELKAEKEQAEVLQSSTAPAPTTSPATTPVTTTAKSVATTTVQTTAVPTTTAPKQVQGDTNEDGKVDVADLVYLNKVLANRAKATAACDVNGDKKINVFDSVSLRKILVKAK